MPGSERFWQLSRLTLLRLLVTSALLLLTHRAILMPVREDPTRALNPLLVAVGGVFLLTLAYLLWLRSRWELELLARVQCAVDPILVSGLVMLTGGLGSPLHFLYALAVLNSALLLGRRDALVVAGMALLLSLLSATLSGYLYELPAEPSGALLLRMLFHGTAFLFTALLGGALAAKVHGLQQAFQQQRDSLADLVSLNRQVVEAMPYGLISVNTGGVIRGANASAGTILEIPPERLAGQPLESVLPEFSGAVTSQGELTMERVGRILHLDASPLFDRQQQVVGTLLVIRDLSNQIRLERELAQREQLALTGRMAASVAHEIRNPLASILSAVQMLDTRDGGQGERLKGIMLEEISRLRQLTTDFLFFARPPDAAREAVEVGPFLHRLGVQLAEDPRWGRERTLDLEHATARVLFDPHHLRQVFLNLLLNAAQAAPQGGLVRVATHPGPMPGRVMVLVADDGPGLQQEALERAMEPFFTTRSTGTGLGLSVVAQLMRANKGDIRLANGAGGGLEVWLTMDAADG